MSEARADLHLSTPLGRLLLATLLMAANLPFWGAVAVGVAVAFVHPIPGLLVMACGLPLSAAVAGWVAARFGRVGGNLAFLPGVSELDGKRVVGLRNWSVEDGWLEAGTRTGPEMRFGSREEVGEAVRRLSVFPGVQSHLEDRMDGFTGACEAREARLDRLFAIPWAALSVGSGFLPFVFVEPGDPVSILMLGALLAFLTLIIALPAAGAGVMVAEILARYPKVSLSMRGNLLEIEGPLSTTRLLVDDPRGVVFTPHTAGTCVAIPTKDGPIRLVCTRPFAAALQERLGRLRPLEGSIELVPEPLRRVRAAASE
ncbi:MAG: hypothetical protein H6737_02945 [Alphaproteobacteria bacterium]|nr:hypothetical protein [Alphaproteobacteria bacterium]